MSAVEIKLFEPVEWFGHLIDMVYLRKPTGNHLQRHGEPRLWVSLAAGGAYAVDQPAAIDGYLADLLSLDGERPIDGGGRAFYSKLALEDAQAVRDALFDFFTQARLRIVARNAPPTRSDFSASNGDGSTS